MAKKKVTKKTSKKKTKKVSKKKESEISDKVSLGEFVRKDGNVFLVADTDSLEENEEEFVRVASYLYRKLISDINDVSKKLDVDGFELKGILKVL